MSTNESNSANKKYKELIAFLDARRTDDKNKATHTRVGTPSGKYQIVGSDVKIFQKLYCDVCDIKNDDGSQKYILNLSEKQKDVGPLMTDYDFEFDSDHTDREYTNATIIYIVRILNNLLYECIDIDKADIIAYVTEKPSPSIVRDSDDDDDECNSSSPIKKVKDGFHICYINPFTKEQRYLIYDKLKKIIVDEDKLKSIPFVNTYDTIIDISTVHRNNWMLYGSRKTLKKPFSEPYKLTRIYDYNGDEMNIEEYKFDYWVDRFSVRQYDEKHKLLTRDDVLNEEEKVAEEYGLRKKDRDTSSVVSDNTPRERAVSEKRGLSNNVEMARKLTALLSAERARGEEDWVRVGWTLHNIDTSLFDDFVKFSKKCKEAFDHNGCEKVWERAKDCGYSIASLHWWAQQDNLKGYHDMIWESVDKKFINIESGKAVDIAKLIRELYKYRFQCASINNTHSGWYEFQGHRWVHIDCASALRNEISEYVVHKYVDISNAYANRIKDLDADSSDIEVARKRANDLLKLSARLRETAPLNSVITECEHKFINQKFVESLNENRYIIGFENGVYDLESGEFRSGFPDDNITFSVGYDWKNFTGNEPVFKDMNEYFDKVTPNPKIREYLLRQISSFARGKNSDQQFIFWTGKGCHSGDTPILMYNGSSKCARDIRIGDNLMGDDSTPRRVRELFNGTQDMYEVVLSDGSSYIANANHRLALKSMYDGDVRFEETSRTYIVTYHKLEEDGPVKCEKYFRVKDSSDEMASMNAIKYLQKKKTKQNIIQLGTVVPVKIFNYINLDESIKKHYRHYRNPIEFQQQPVIIDPYKLGNTMGSTAIPTQYKFNSTQIRMKVLAGILDKFGSIEDHKVTITARSRVFMGDCIFMCRSLGFHIDIVSAEKIRLTGNFIDVPTKLFKIYLNEYNIVHDLTYEFKVNGIGKGKFFGFSVDKNERYILQNCIVTYNSNGKSLLTDLIKKTFGDYYKTMDPTVLTRKRGSSSNATPELADKNGVRIIFLSEPEEDDKVYSSNMKKFTGATDEICARPLYGDEFTYVPQFKMVMVCNDLPEILGKDDGTWRRIRVVPFEAEFVDGVPTEPNQFKKDKLLEEKMKTWCNAFMWLLLKKYYPKYCKDGLSEPDEVKLKTSKYRHDNDVYSEFIDTTYERTRNSSDKVSLTVFFTEFKTWYHDAFAGEKCPARNMVKNYIERSNTIKLVDGMVTGLKIKKLELDEFK